MTKKWKIFLVMTYAFLKWPKFEQFQFLSLSFMFEISSSVNFLKWSSFYVRNFRNTPFFLFDSENDKNLAFQIFRT